MPTSLRRGAFAAALLSTLATPLVAQTPADTTASGPPALTAADLEIFMDGIVPLAMKSSDIVGSVVSVVKDGQILFAKGYGWADRENKVSVDADRTLFRVASISKLFTATAVMQLVEQGKLNLDEDIAAYLDIQLDRRYQDKITLRHLLTHTAGFEESFKEIPADSGQGVALREWIAEGAPALLYRPGTVTSYSNYGSDLAGYIVERVSGVPFAEYVRINILEPLGMRSSSIAQPLPPELLGRLSKEYPSASDSAGRFEILQGEPSGNLSATATDMARFALAHLALGRAGEIRILEEETARLMGRTAFRTHPDVPGMALGFFEESRNGRRIIGHGGDLSRFHSHLSLLMDEGVGFFVSMNSTGGGTSQYGLREVVRDAFLDRYFPRPTPVEPVVANAVEVSRRWEGAYTLSRRGESTMARVIGLLIDLSVSANPDGSLQIAFLTGPAGRPMRWYPIDSSLYRNDDGSQLIGFVPATDELPIRGAFVGGHELHRTAPTDGRGFNLFVLIGSLMVFAGTLLLWPVAALARRRYGAPMVKDGVGRGLRIATRLTALVSIGFVVAIGAFIMLALDDAIERDSRSDWILGLIRVLGLLGVAGTVASLAALLQSLRGNSGLARLKYLLLVVAGVGFSWFIIHWNLLSTSFKY